MAFSGDLNDLPRPVLYGGIAGVAVVFIGLLLFLINSFVYPIIRPGVAHVPPPKGFPDVEPYNTPAWIENYKKTGATSANGRPGGPMMPPPPGAPIPGQPGSMPVGGNTQ